MRGGAVWAGVAIPVVTPDGWSAAELDDGQRALERLHRELDAARCALLRGSGVSDRDAASRHARVVGVSTRTARDRVRVALVTSKVAGAAAALSEGAVSSEHLVALAPVADHDEASELLPLALVQSPEEFARSVQRFQLARNGVGLRARQRAARSVSFFPAEEGCGGMRAVLTPAECAELRARLWQLADDAWRAEHPDRARIAGGAGGASLRQRLADALMVLVRGEAKASSRPSIVVVVDAERLEAEVAGTGPGAGPIDLSDAAALCDRSDLYAAVRGMDGSILHFGRTRRYATALQRLAVIARDGGRCAFDGCDVSHEHCELHHTEPWERGGRTDLPSLCLLCRKHHPHLHAHGLRLIRDGTRWTVVPDADVDVEWLDTG